MLTKIDYKQVMFFIGLVCFRLEKLMLKKGGLYSFYCCFGMFLSGKSDFSASAVRLLNLEVFCDCRVCPIGCCMLILTLVIGTLNPKGYIHEISQKSRLSSSSFWQFFICPIGPFFAIPRTAAAFSIGFALLGSGHTSLWLFWQFTLL